MGGVDDQHGVELEADRRARLHIADAGEQQGCEDFLVAQLTSPNAWGDLLEQAFPWCRLDELDDRFDLRPQPHDIRFGSRLGGAHGREGVEDAEIP